MKVIHSGNVGDAIYSIPYCLTLKPPITYLLECNVQATYAPGMAHPCGPYRMTEDYARSLIPLLESQSWCEKAELWSDQEFDVDLDEFRRIPQMNFCCLPRCYFWQFGGFFDLAKKWLVVKADKSMKDMIAVSRTGRYRNPRIDYNALDKYKNRLVFLGLQAEYDAFERETSITCAHIIARDFLHLARLIAGSKLYISNQSSGFALAEGMKANRVLEVCPAATNVSALGPGGRDAITQAGWLRSIEEALGE